MVKKAATKAADSTQPGLIDVDPVPASTDATAKFEPADESIIDDVLAAMIDMAGQGADTTVRQRLTQAAQRVSQQKHHEWAGERVYVARNKQAMQANISSRNAAIQRDHQRGERVPLLMRRYGLTRRRIEQILNAS